MFRRYMKTIFKWLFRLFLLVVVVFVVFLLSLDTILRSLTEHNIRVQTGLEVEIGSFHLGLLDPVITIKDFKLHNPPDFGGTLFVSIPEIHVEYDRDALAAQKLHVKLLRFNLGELDIVKNAAGKTNLYELGVTLPNKGALSQTNSADQLKALKARLNLDFKGIDTLNVSIGTFKYIDLGDPKNNREQNLGIDNQIIPHVNSLADLGGMMLLIALRSGDVYSGLLSPGTL